MDIKLTKVGHKTLVNLLTNDFENLKTAAFYAKKTSFSKSVTCNCLKLIIKTDDCGL